MGSIAEICEERKNPYYLPETRHNRGWGGREIDILGEFLEGYDI